MSLEWPPYPWRGAFLGLRAILLKFALKNHYPNLSPESGIIEYSSNGYCYHPNFRRHPQLHPWNDLQMIQLHWLQYSDRTIHLFPRNHLRQHHHHRHSLLFHHHRHSLLHLNLIHLSRNHLSQKKGHCEREIYRRLLRMLLYLIHLSLPPHFA